MSSVLVTGGAGYIGSHAVSSERARSQLGWRPRFQDIDVIVETAWRWREQRPRGYDDRAAG